MSDNQPLPGPPAGGSANPSFGEALRVWGQIGLMSFGGPAGQIALMHRVLVEQKKWLDEATYLLALNFCTLLPGPEAMQLATYAGWKMHGTRGGLAAGLLFVAPGAVIILVLAALYASFGSVPVVAAVFTGIKAAVLAIVIEALIRIARRTLKGRTEWLIALASFVGIFIFNGLGLAETTPGPLILVTEFVGFLAAARHGGEPALLFGLLGAAVTLWATFAPCFLYVFAGAPYVEWLKSVPRLKASLSAITAAVVGVIFNLSLWFTLHVLFRSRFGMAVGPVAFRGAGDREPRSCSAQPRHFRCGSALRFANRGDHNAWRCRGDITSPDVSALRSEPPLLLEIEVGDDGCR